MPMVAPDRNQRASAGLVAVDGRTFPLRASRIEARAEGGIAATRLVQDYENPHAEPLEVLYTMPLPADGAVLGYTIRLGDRTVTGEIESRAAARERYLEALEQGRAAGLLEQVRADTFTQTLGSLPPGVPVTVEIDVLHPLVPRTAAGPGAHATGAAAPLEWEYRFPTVVGARYQGAPGRVPDAGKLDAPRADGGGTPVRLEIDLAIVGAPAGAAPRSPSHAIATEHTDGSETRVRLASPSRLDRDLVIRWPATEGEGVGARLVEGTGLPGDPGRYALLTLTPPAGPAAVMARDLTFLLDASGSMTGTPLERAKRVAEVLLKSLDPPDRFEILAFSNTVTRFTKGLVPAESAAIEAALARLRDLSAGGGTEMASAIAKALEPLGRESQRQVVLVTDGYVGFEREVVARLLEELPAGSRLHTVGVGSAPNRSLTRPAARAGRGIEILVTDGADVDEAAASLVRATAAPVLTEVAVAGTAVAGVAPKRPPDVHSGRPLLVALGLLAGGGTIEVSGRLAGRAEAWRTTLDVPPLASPPRPAGAPSGEPEPAGGPDPEASPQSAPASLKLPLGALYGRELVEDAEMRVAAGAREVEGDGKAEIETLGLRHRIVTRFTSLVAVSEDRTVDPRSPRRRERLAVELPHEVSAEGLGYGVSLKLRKMTDAFPLLSCGPREDVRFENVVAQEGPRLRSPRFVPIEVVGRLVRREMVMVVEFEVPEGGVQLPGDSDGVSIEWQGEVTRARVLGERSTRAGRHEAGRTVRLAFALALKDPSPLVGRTLSLTWTVRGVTHVVRLENE